MTTGLLFVLLMAISLVFLVVVAKWPVSLSLSTTSILILLLTLIAVAILIRRHAVSKRSKEQLRLRELEDTVARLTQEKSSGDDSHQS